MTQAPAPDQAAVLPPFTGDDAVCPKCSHFETFTRYRPAKSMIVEDFNGEPRRGPLPERLERECARCDFAWDEALLPPAEAADAPPATVEDLAYALARSHDGRALDLSPGCAEHMARQLLAMLTVTLRLDHPVWHTPQTTPLQVASPAKVMEQTGTHMTSAVPIPLHESPLVPADAPHPSAAGFGAPGGEA
ncbi:hypothetical protein [Streptomyces sp. DH8]|uniref:hypothetical protein n=1 Tax=Streptomyces sp. DH8 TaxID=2857008 RepID=UPI001E3B0B40|nr:hypothetical protein [Streptomyces sp. DH8]